MAKLFDTLLFTILAPFSFLWDWAYRVRRFCYNYGIFKQNNFRVPIISIGNLTFGGTGKTPFTLWLSNYFTKMDKRVMILMRGYRGKLEHGTGILRSERKLGFNPFEYGDEALLLALRLENASIVVGKKRSENLDYYFEKESPDVVLLDDGHQHLQLKRKLNIVLFDALMPLSRYKVAPRGYMREGFSALKDAELIVLGRCDQVSREKIDSLKELISPYLNSQVPFAEIRYLPTGLYNGRFEKCLSIKDLEGRKVIALAGLASPLSFYSSIESLGAEIIKKKAFPDHHFFKAEEVLAILKQAEEESALVITTEKDIVKLRRIVDDDRLLYLKIEVDFLRGEREAKEIISKAFQNSY